MPDRASSALAVSVLVLAWSSTLLAQTGFDSPIIEPRFELESDPASPREQTRDAADPEPSLDLETAVAPLPERAAEPRRHADEENFLGDGLRRVEWLLRAGALGLAERVLLEQRPPESSADDWMAWERRLWDIYRERQRWDALAGRVENLPDSLPREFLLEARGLGVEALMQERRYEEARSRLRDLLLVGDAPPLLFADWRRKVFTTYLWEDRLADADLAMLAYQNDYYPDDHAWNIARARVLIRAGEADAAVSQVASVTTPEGTLVGLFARLLNGTMTPNEVIDRTLAIDDKALDDGLRQERHLLVAEAARRAGLWPDRVRALEQALAITPTRTHQRLIEVGADELVDAYTNLASRVANAGNLLVGDFDGWMRYADGALRDSPVGARAVFVYVGRSVAVPELANDAFSRLAASLREGGLKSVIFQLFGDGKPLGGFEMLRGPVGYLLSEEALEDGDIRLAAALSTSIVQPPAGVSYFDWRLRQARMSVYAGNIEEGIDVLESLTAALTTLRDDEADRLLQVVFDLQALGRHTEALPLLERILAMTKDSDRQREVLYWLAESLAGSGRPEQAALYFLRSSTMASGNGMWEQSARYRAAGALQDAGLIDDARALYRQLLSVTRDPARRDQLTRKLQDLWLLDNKQEAGASDT